MDEQYKRILSRVQKPARYTGGEYGECVKDTGQMELQMAFCFPDTYEIGMSNLGMRILYGAINEGMDNVWCQRAFAPWSDMETELRSAGVPLRTLESGIPVGECDVIAFSMGYEMAYTNVLNMLDLAGVPVRSADRCELFPLVFAGGTSCCNPEPMADFMDLFVIGEGEELDIEVLQLLTQAKRESWSKQTFLREAADIPGVYVPSLYEVSYNGDGTLAAVSPLDGVCGTVTKRIVQDFEHSYFPTRQIVPSTEIVHDRVSVELFRGCVRGCRFCQAGYAYRPIRSRSAGRLVEQGVELLENTGFQEISLASLSTSDYRELGNLCDGLLDWCRPRMVNLSLPSLRADNFSMALMRRVQEVRKSGLTFAPEAGSQRLRDVINKNVTEEELLESCRVAFEGGYSSVKLYFMLGLPTETDEDVLAIAALANKVLYTWKSHASNKTRGLRITVSTSCFVPKPHTPFQWEAQISMEEYMRRVTLLRENMRSKAISYNWHDAQTGYIEAVLSRGDRRLAAVIEAVWRNGGRMESWSEFFDLERWLDAFKAAGLSADFYACRERSEDELLPWSVVNMGIDAAHFKRERERAYAAVLTGDCRSGCANCGARELSDGGECDG